MADDLPHEMHAVVESDFNGEFVVAVCEDYGTYLDYLALQLEQGKGRPEDYNLRVVPYIRSTQHPDWAVNEASWRRRRAELIAFIDAWQDRTCPDWRLHAMSAHARLDRERLQAERESGKGSP